MAAETMMITAHQLKAGQVVRQHGGRFLVLEDARPSAGHAPADGIGPTDCAVARAVCVEGQAGGYFWPGSDWTLQGNQLARMCVEA